MGMCQSRPKASAPRAKELHTQIQTEDWPGLGDRGLSAPPGLGTLGMGSCPRCGEPSDREDKLRAVGRPGLLPGGEKPEPLGDSAPAPPSMSQTINRHRGLGWSKAGGAQLGAAAASASSGARSALYKPRRAFRPACPTWRATQAQPAAPTRGRERGQAVKNSPPGAACPLPSARRGQAERAPHRLQGPVRDGPQGHEALRN